MAQLASTWSRWRWALIGHDSTYYVLQLFSFFLRRSYTPHCIRYISSFAILELVL